MVHKFNKFKSIRKGLMGPNIILPAVYILLSADQCPGGAAGWPSFPSNNKLPISSASFSSLAPNQVDSLKNPNEDQGDAFKSVLGKGMLLNLDGYQCGVFVTSDTKEVFIIKLHSQDGWMQLYKKSKHPGVLGCNYDAFNDPRIIKVDYGLFERLRQQLDQSPDIGQLSSDKEDFWRKIEKDYSWRNIEFFYKESIGDRAIFREDGITPSTAFTKELYQKFNSTNSLISSKLSISGNVASTTLKDLEKVGFLLVKKDTNGLVHLVKNMLEGDAEWATKAEIADAKDYITCPALLVGDISKFDSSDSALQLQGDHSSSRLEDFEFVYCYFNDGEYYRLMALDRVTSFIKTDIEQPNQFYLRQVKPLSKNITTTPIDKDGTEVSPSDDIPDGVKLSLNSEDQNDGEPNSIDGEQAHLPINSLEEVSTQDKNPTQAVRTSPMQYTGVSATTPLPSPPPPPPPSSDQQNRSSVLDNDVVTSGSVPPPPPPPMPTSIGSGVNVGSVPPPPPPPMPTSIGSGVNAGSVPPPLQLSLVRSAPLSVNTSKQGVGPTAKLNKNLSSNNGSLVNELKKTLQQKQQLASPNEPSVAGKTIDEQVKEYKNQNKSPLDMMFEQIKGGVKLRPLVQQPEKDKNNSSCNHLIDVLRDALEQREKDMKPQPDSESSESESEEDEDEDEDKWA